MNWKRKTNVEGSTQASRWCTDTRTQQLQSSRTPYKVPDYPDFEFGWRYSLPFVRSPTEGCNTCSWILRREPSSFTITANKSTNDNKKENSFPRHGFWDMKNPLLYDCNHATQRTVWQQRSVSKSSPITELSPKVTKHFFDVHSFFRCTVPAVHQPPRTEDKLRKTSYWRSIDSETDCEEAWNRARVNLNKRCWQPKPKSRGSKPNIQAIGSQNQNREHNKPINSFCSAQS